MTMNAHHELPEVLRTAQQADAPADAAGANPNARGRRLMKLCAPESRQATKIRLLSASGLTMRSVSMMGPLNQ